jgi:hypothetical protein
LYPNWLLTVQVDGQVIPNLSAPPNTFAATSAPLTETQANVAWGQPSGNYSTAISVKVKERRREEKRREEKRREEKRREEKCGCQDKRKKEISHRCLVLAATFVLHRLLGLRRCQQTGLHWVHLCHQPE